MTPREYHLKRKYGITLAQYTSILKAQGLRCAVCHRPYTDFKVSLAVDHDHRTKEIYGLLCTYCNHRVIGRERDWRKFEAAAEYLKKGLGIFVPTKKRSKRRTKKRSRKA